MVLELVEGRRQPYGRHRCPTGKPGVLPVEVLLGIFQGKPQLQRRLWKCLSYGVPEGLVLRSHTQHRMPVREHRQQGRQPHQPLFRRPLLDVHGDEVVVGVRVDGKVSAEFVREQDSRVGILYPPGGKGAEPGIAQREQPQRDVDGVAVEPRRGRGGLFLIRDARARATP